ncbi:MULTISPECIES: hypothetical protein [unclassified Streptomyces]|uniref:hypothetical protein n=1 Tax=unclassified Streptomyces TaxID=2593676 RepID=UPI0033B9A05A
MAQHEQPTLGWPGRASTAPCGFATHHLPLEDAPEAYATYQAKQDGMVKTLLRP